MQAYFVGSRRGRWSNGASFSASPPCILTCHTYYKYRCLHNRSLHVPLCQRVRPVNDSKCKGRGCWDKLPNVDQYPFAASWFDTSRKLCTWQADNHRIDHVFVLLYSLTLIDTLMSYFCTEIPSPITTSQPLSLLRQSVAFCTAWGIGQSLWRTY